MALVLSPREEGGVGEESRSPPGSQQAGHAGRSLRERCPILATATGASSSHQTGSLRTSQLQPPLFSHLQTHEALGSTLYLNSRVVL